MQLGTGERGMRVQRAARLLGEQAGHAGGLKPRPLVNNFSRPRLEVDRRLEVRGGVCGAGDACAAEAAVAVDAVGKLRKVALRMPAALLPLAARLLGA